MPSPTLLRWFSESLPDITIVGPRSGKTPMQAHESSQTVKAEVPPRILIRDNGAGYLPAAERFLQTHAASLALEHGPLLEPVRTVENEADVVAQARAHLMAPIMVALDYEATLRGQTRLSCELSLNKLRVDLGLVCKFKQGKGIVMMVEFKRAKIINPIHFMSAMWNPEEVDGDWVPIKDDLDRYLDLNSAALKLMKQAKAYALRAQCLYIALCDYESLILLKFNNDLTVVKVTIVDKLKTTFRIALFGFLLTAIKHYEDVPSVQDPTA